MRKLFIIILLLPAIAGCKKHKGFDRVKDAEVVDSDLLECLAGKRAGQYAIITQEQLEDSLTFAWEGDSTLVETCWSTHSDPGIDFSSRTLIGMNYVYFVESTVNNGSASAKIWKNSAGDMIIDVTVQSADQGAFPAFGQIWFTVPAISVDNNVEFNKQLI